VVLIDAGDPWGGGRVPPIGRLREPATALRRADAVIITKVPVDWRPVVSAIEAEVDRIAPALQVFISRVVPHRLRKPDGGWVEPEELRQRRVFAFAGVGRPGGFVESLREAGAEIVGERWFPDHHPYTEREVTDVAAAAGRVNAIPVTTAKDAVKLPGDSPVWVMEIEMVPVEGSWRGLWRMLPEVSV